ncbi:L-glutamate gamma-semialdehyde dehydrogenase [Limnochorda pilosa]|uniref:L-glutamate gamma-semialdehyde dehydrogenase n=1 Tax=Limnochorda pilosa TaxID=1555112 RepID=A0A0K2SIC2_LIMPI|nr:L-glutamate gamma-semialdehyde dehydrogenase [Limnochorda pilosa]BAS26589.1 1-pyrroline-5-carboxylate dehydrogenase [Limnochorda pilosa]
MVPEFRNDPMIDFSVPENRRAMEETLARVRGELGREYPLVIGGQKVWTGGRIRSINPSNNRELVGLVAKATAREAEQALEAAWDAFPQWSAMTAPARARLLFKAAAIMRRRKMELSAWEVVEAGKTWDEAVGDVNEAIDFMEYYGREAIRLAEPHELTPFPGEETEAFWIPLGVGVIIPPWNFPLAILTGMTTGPVAAGNTVILKPASATPVIGAKFMEVMEEAGLPPGVINFLPGSGGEIGDFLVSHPRTRFISFTGSMEVGLRINQLAAEPHEGQIWVKRVVAEMGGKDAIVVDETADLDAAAEGIVASAFGYQGQKCSACSRAILVDAVYDQVLAKIVERTRALRVGDPAAAGTQVAAVIDQAAYEKILSYIEIGKQEGRVVAGGEKGDETGFFIQPTVIADVNPNARIAQEEIFGPVLAVIRARDYDDALRIANGTMYGLTGSVYSRDRVRLERARREFHVGNLYFNRKCTGSLVGVHPFGGFNMSGTDAKTGSHEYLLNFLQAKAVSEKL